MPRRTSGGVCKRDRRKEIVVIREKTIDIMALDMYNTIMTVDESYNRKLIDETGTVTKLEMY